MAEQKMEDTTLSSLQDAQKELDKIKSRVAKAKVAATFEPVKIVNKGKALGKRLNYYTPTEAWYEKKAELKEKKKPNALYVFRGPGKAFGAYVVYPEKR